MWNKTTITLKIAFGLYTRISIIYCLLSWLLFLFLLLSLEKLNKFAIVMAYLVNAFICEFLWFPSNIHHRACKGRKRIHGAVISLTAHIQQVRRTLWVYGIHKPHDIYLRFYLPYHIIRTHTYSFIHIQYNVTHLICKLVRIVFLPLKFFT